MDPAKFSPSNRTSPFLSQKSLIKKKRLYNQVISLCLPFLIYIYDSCIFHQKIAIKHSGALSALLLLPINILRGPTLQFNNYYYFFFFFFSYRGMKIKKLSSDATSTRATFFIYFFFRHPHPRRATRD